jgi:glycerophosphoryl diester phosphodiesterase
MRVFLIAGWALAALAVVTGSAGAQAKPATLLAAHRGGALLWPENSLLAFRNAVALGADFIEFDVHLSRDGEVMVIHDPTLDRTTNGRGAVRDRTVAELKTLRLKDRAGAVTGETVPTLDEVTAVASQGGRRMLLEIKVDAARARYPGIEEKVLAILDRHRMAGSTVVMAFEPATWKRMRELRPDLATCALYSARMLGRTTLAAELETLRAAGVGFVGLEHTVVDAAALAQARHAGVEVGAWTVNDAAAMERLIDAGVGVLITDQPDVAKALLGR